MMLNALVKKINAHFTNAHNNSHGIRLATGTIEFLKWLALVLMTLDHVNKYLFQYGIPGAFELGRLAMPLFAFIMAYNLARPDAMSNGAYIRTMKRLALYGLAATPFFMGLGGLALGGWWPLNIMFMLLAATATLYFATKGGIHTFAAVAVFVFGGAIVEFWWFAMTFFFAAWWYCKTASKAALLGMTFAAASLYFANQNFWALGLIPLILVAPLYEPKIPRFQRIFYVYYPTHLAILLIISNFTMVHV